MSDPVQFSATFPDLISSVTVQSPAPFPVTIPSETPPSVQNAVNFQISVSLPELPSQVIVIPGGSGAGSPGPAGANAQTTVLTLAAYLALSAPQQMDGTWYVIPK
jgi:hypothetical protein